MKSTFAAVAAIGLVTSVIACGGGGSYSSSNVGNVVCTAMGGGSSHVTSTPNTGGSSFGNPNYAFDGNLDSIATLSAGITQSGGGTIRGTAQSGTIETAGKIAGIYITTPAAGTTVSITINTYLGGATQDQERVIQETYGNAGVQNCTPGATCENKDDGKTSYYGLTTAKNFDAIEAVISLSGSASPMEIHELCVR